MELKTKRGLIANVAKAYRRRHYSDSEGWFQYTNPPIDSEARYEQLLALPEDANEQQIIALVNYNGWTQNICNECGRDVEVTVMLGEEPDHESCTAWICPECLGKALELAKAT